MSPATVSATEVQIAFADYLRFRRENEGLSREKLAQKSAVPPSTIKKFERTGKISFYQLLLLWKALDDLKVFYELSQHYRKGKTIPTSISEVSQTVILNTQKHAASEEGCKDESSDDESRPIDTE